MPSDCHALYVCTKFGVDSSSRFSSFIAHPLADSQSHVDATLITAAGAEKLATYRREMSGTRTRGKTAERTET